MRAVSVAFGANWRNILFIIPMHVIGFTAWPLYLALGGSIQWQEILVFFVMMLAAVIGIDVGYHRGFSHLSFKMSPFMKWLSLFCGSSMAEGSALSWCADHRRHHRYQDSELDPYNIKRGFWWAHIGWILGSESTTDFSNCPDLEKDPVIRHQHKYYAGWLALSCFGLPLALGFLVGRPLECFLLAGLFRLAFMHHSTFLINSYAHYFGRQPYSTEITAKDSLICAILASGEGWHNFHHRFPWDYRNGHRFYHYDPTKWMIWMGQFLGLTSNLKRTPAPEIYRARIQALKGKYAQHPHETSAAHHALQEAYNRWHELYHQWQQLLKKREQGGREQLEQLRLRLHQARKQFMESYHAWKESLNLEPMAG